MSIFQFQVTIVKNLEFPLLCIFSHLLVFFFLNNKLFLDFSFLHGFSTQFCNVVSKASILSSVNILSKEDSKSIVEISLKTIGLKNSKTPSKKTLMYTEEASKYVLTV
jgi:hypothetical protein